MSKDLESDWRPGHFDRVRALARRVVRATFGERVEAAAHGAYHRMLRGIGRFGPPEDEATLALLRALASRSRTILDIGANVGRYAWFLHRHSAADTTLIALEPHPGAARLLRTALSGRPRCTVLELAAAGRDSSGRLHVPRGSFGGPVAGLSWVDPAEVADDGLDHAIQLRRLDGLVAEGTITVVDPLFMKIDVEGYEASVLEGAAELVRRHRPVIYFECEAALLGRSGESPPESAWQQLTQAGYRIFGNDRAGGFSRMRRADPATVNYLGIPDAEGDVPTSLDAAAMERMLDAWVVRVSGQASAVAAT